MTNKTIKFEIGQLYVQYVTGYKVIYRITKRTSKKLYLYGVKIETENPYTVFGAGEGPKGLLYDLSQLYDETSIDLSYINDSEGYEYIYIWNREVGTIGLSSLNKVDKI